MMQNMDFDWLGLSGKKVVITGAASGIGEQMAISAAQAAAHVILMDINPDSVMALKSSLVEQGYKVDAFACNTAELSQVQEVAKTVARLGGADVLVNNAGILRTAALADVTPEQWLHVLQVNLSGYLWCAQQFGAQMQAKGKGSIVNVASIAALFPQSNSGAYSSSKAGVLLLSKQLAVEWGPKGVRSNVVCPGMIKTSLSAAFYADPELEAARARMTASRRVGIPQDIANAVLFLASERAGYVNGTELLVDGGMSTVLMDMVPRPGFNKVTGVVNQEVKA
ncbi:SDR family NAD(P)-dependent oxidoreductase [Paenalcaligenes hominis]|uniref:SDR family NAD(P)-dependent oxidoreductase n=1 Tax=Paenalcaligenes hominis TaxID=643674 RepID=UPI0035238E3D